MDGYGNELNMRPLRKKVHTRPNVTMVFQIYRIYSSKTTWFRLMDIVQAMANFGALKRFEVQSISWPIAQWPTYTYIHCSSTRDCISVIIPITLFCMNPVRFVRFSIHFILPICLAVLHLCYSMACKMLLIIFTLELTVSLHTHTRFHCCEKVCLCARLFSHVFVCIPFSAIAISRRQR